MTKSSFDSSALSVSVKTIITRLLWSRFIDLNLICACLVWLLSSCNQKSSVTRAFSSCLAATNQWSVSLSLRGFGNWDSCTAFSGLSNDQKKAPQVILDIISGTSGYNSSPQLSTIATPESLVTASIVAHHFCQVNPASGQLILVSDWLIVKPWPQTL